MSDPKPTARIRADSNGGLWLLVDPPGSNKAAVEDILMFLDQDPRLSEPGAVAYPIVTDEVTAIRDACNAWLEEAGDAA